MSNPFKKKHSFDDRKAESTKIKAKYEDRIPVIVHKDPKSSLEDINKNKFLTPGDLTLAQFIYVIRKRIKVDESVSLFVFVNDTILAPTSHTMNTLYEQHKDSDGFLYLIYCSENVFGN